MRNAGLLLSLKVCDSLSIVRLPFNPSLTLIQRRSRLKEMLLLLLVSSIFFGGESVSHCLEWLTIRCQRQFHPKYRLHIRWNPWTLRVQECEIKIVWHLFSVSFFLMKSVFVVYCCFGDKKRTCQLDFSSMHCCIFRWEKYNVNDDQENL
jgi:hypothetical protein